MIHKLLSLIWTDADSFFLDLIFFSVVSIKILDSYLGLQPLSVFKPPPHQTVTQPFGSKTIFKRCLHRAYGCRIKFLVQVVDFQTEKIGFRSLFFSAIFYFFGLCIISFVPRRKKPFYNIASSTQMQLQLKK
jgi:hypothetical protein